MCVDEAMVAFKGRSIMRQHIAFPNISPLRADVLRYGITFDPPRSRRFL